MRKQFIFCLSVLALILLCDEVGISQSRRKRSRATSLPPSAIKFPADLAKHLLQDDESVRTCLEESYGGNESKLFRHFKVKQVDLNQDKQPEYIVEANDDVNGLGGCFGDWRGHFAIWIYRKTTSGYEPLVTGLFSVGVQLLKTSTNGYRDLKDSGHNGVLLIDTIYEFDGSRYKAAQCLTYEFVETGKGVSTKLISRDDCSGYPGIKDN